MTEQEAHNSVQIKFKNHVSYSMIKNLNARFGRIFMSHGVHIRQKHMKCAYDLFIYTKVPNAKRSIQMQTTSKIHYFHGRRSTLSALRTPFKLKSYKCSYRCHLEKNSRSRFNDSSYYF